MDPPRNRQKQQPVRPHRRRKRKIKLRFVFFNVLLFTFIIGLSAVGYASWRVDLALDSMTQASPAKPVEPSQSVKVLKSSSPDTKSLKEEEKNSMSLLIMGRDYRPETGTNLTDVMIVAGFDLDNGLVSMVSIPRDTKVHLPGISAPVKANEALNTGDQLLKRDNRNNRQPSTDGPIMAKQMASNLFDIPIDNYVLIDFKSFQAIVDEVDGIRVNVDRDMVYNDPTDGTHINLRAGIQQLNGKKALDWVRHRHDDRGSNFYSSDFDRNERQKEAIRAIAGKLTTMDGMTRIFNVMDAMSNHIQTDLTKEQIKELVWSLKTLNMDNIQNLETPNVYWDSVGMQTVIPDEDLSAIHEELNHILHKGKSS